MVERKTPTRLALLQATRDLLVTQPYSEVSLGRVAATAGVSRQAVYLHFSSKTDLLLSLVSWIDDDGRLPQLMAEVFSHHDPVDRFLAGIRAAASYNADIADVGLALHAASRTDPAASRAWEDRMAARLEGSHAFLEPIEASGRLRAGWTIQTATDALFALTSLTTYDDLVRARGWAQADYEQRLVMMAKQLVLVDRFGEQDER